MHCRRAHHSLLHVAAATVKAPVNQALEVDDTKAVANASSALTTNVQNVQEEIALVRALLATAWINLYTPKDQCLKVRILLDRGSTVSFISESLCQTLRTKRQRAEFQIRYFGDNYTGLARSKISLRLGSCAKSGTVTFTACVFQRITIYSFADSVSPFLAPHLLDFALADPNLSSR